MLPNEAPGNHDAVTSTKTPSCSKSTPSCDNTCLHSAPLSFRRRVHDHEHELRVRRRKECTGMGGAAAAEGEAAEGAATAWVLGLIPRTSGRRFVLRISARCIRSRSRTGHEYLSRWMAVESGGSGRALLALGGPPRRVLPGFRV